MQRGAGAVAHHRERFHTHHEARTTAQLRAVEKELAEERVKLEYTEEEILEMERKEEQGEAVSER